jgi:flagellar protein FliL
VASAVIIDAEAELIADEAPATPPPARRRKGPLLIAGAALIALLGAGGASYALLGGKAHEAPKAASGDAAVQAYIDVPPVIVNLRSSDGRARFLKLHFMLVAADAGQSDAIKAKLPLYLDALQPFLRELRPEDLNGSAAVFRMKEEMMARANDALGTGMVRDVLIQDLIQQ